MRASTPRNSLSALCRAFYGKVAALLDNWLRATREDPSILKRYSEPRRDRSAPQATVRVILVVCLLLDLGKAALTARFA